MTRDPVSWPDGDGDPGITDLSGLYPSVRKLSDRNDQLEDELTRARREHARLRSVMESWSRDGAEYRHALDHVVACTECPACSELARDTLDRTTMGRRASGTFEEGT